MYNHSYSKSYELNNLKGYPLKIQNPKFENENSRLGFIESVHGDNGRCDIPHAA